MNFQNYLKLVINARRVLIYPSIIIFLSSCLNDSDKINYLSLDLGSLELKELNLSKIPKGNYEGIKVIKSDIILSLKKEKGNLLEIYNYEDQLKSYEFAPSGNQKYQYQYPIALNFINDGIFISDPNRLSIDQFNKSTNSYSKYLILGRDYLGSRNLSYQKINDDSFILGKLIHRYTTPSLYFRDKIKQSKQAFGRSVDSLIKIPPPSSIKKALKEHKFLNLLTESIFLIKPENNIVVCAMKYFNKIFLYKDDKLMKTIEINNLNKTNRSIINNNGFFEENSIIYYGSGFSNKDYFCLLLFNDNIVNYSQSHKLNTNQKLLVFNWDLKLIKEYVVSSKIKEIDGLYTKEVPKIIGIKNVTEENSEIVEFSLKL